MIAFFIEILSWNIIKIEKTEITKCGNKKLNLPKVEKELRKICNRKSGALAMLFTTWQLYEATK